MHFLYYIRSSKHHTWYWLIAHCFCLLCKRAREIIMKIQVVLVVKWHNSPNIVSNSPLLCMLHLKCWNDNSSISLLKGLSGGWLRDADLVLERIPWALISLWRVFGGSSVKNIIKLINDNKYRQHWYFMSHTLKRVKNNNNPRVN